MLDRYKWVIGGVFLVILVIALSETCNTKPKEIKDDIESVQVDIDSTIKTVEEIKGKAETLKTRTEYIIKYIERNEENIPPIDTTDLELDAIIRRENSRREADWDKKGLEP